MEPFHNIFKYCGIRDLHFVEFHNISWSDVFFCGIGSGNGLAKAESIFHKILDRLKKNVGGDNLWSRSTKFETIVEFVTFILWNSTIFLGLTYFCGIGFVNSAFANTLFIQINFPNFTVKIGRDEKYIRITFLLQIF